MGKLHWDRHALKPPPIKDEVFRENLRLVIRERPRARRGYKYVATIRYEQPPVPGNYVVVFAYGGSPARAELAVFDALYRKETYRGSGQPFDT